MLKTIFNLPSKEEKERAIADKIITLISEDEADIQAEVKRKISRLPQSVRLSSLGSEILAAAVKTGRFELVQFLLKDFNLNPNCVLKDPVSKEFRTPLINAVEKGHREIAKMLIKDYNADPELSIVATEQEVTPLLFAMFVQDKLMVQLLCELGASVDYVKDFKGKKTTTLHQAIQWRVPDAMFQILLAHSKAPDTMAWIQDGSKWLSGSPLALAREIGSSLGVIKMLEAKAGIQYDPNSDPASGSGLTALERAMKIQENIKELKAHPTYLDHEAIERKKKELENSISFSVSIDHQVDRLRRDPSYLNMEAIQKIWEEKQREQAARQQQNQANSRPSAPDIVDDNDTTRVDSRELECVVHLEIPTLEMKIYSCINHHLICQMCLKSLPKQYCPQCMQDFTVYPPERNHLAERIVRSLQG